MAKSKEGIALDACTKVTTLGNRISVHMLEYLSTVKDHPEGFEQLTREFLDVCRILFSIEAGLSDANKSGKRFPSDMVIELERKFRSTQSDFQELDRMIHKFLEYEHKGTVGRIQKGFRRVFPDHDIHRMRESLSRSREALRMSALVFQWSLGEARIEQSVGIGYTGLAAALDRINGNRPALSDPTPNAAESSDVLGQAITTPNSAALPAPAQNPGSSNGASNGASNGSSPNSTSHGMANGTTNGLSNGLSNGHTNGTANGTINSGLSRTRTADPPSPPPQHEPPPLQSQTIKSSMLDIGLASNTRLPPSQGNELNGPPRLPAPQFLSDRSAGKEFNLSDELRLFPELRNRTATSNHTSASSTRETLGTGTGTITSNTSRSRIMSTVGGNGSASQIQSSTTAVSHGSAHGSGLNNGNGNGYASRMPALDKLSDNFDAISLAASTAADSESNAHGLAPPTHIRVVRLKADPFSMPRWSPRNTAGAGAANLKAALLSAVQGANYTLVEQLLDRGVSPDGGLLQEALMQRDLESIRLLLLFGADPNAADKTGVTPLVSAVEEGFAEGATLLLKYGADPNRDALNVTKDRAESPLVTAFTSGKLGLAQLMLAYGGDPDRPVQRSGHSSSDSDSGADNTTTLLLSAIGRKKPRKMVDLLLAYGANPNKKDSHGGSPLYQAVHASRPDVVSALLDHGADVNLPGPKHVLWPATHHPSSLPVLLSRGADMRKTPGILELATSLNKYDAVRALLDNGADVNAKKDGAYTALCTAIRDDHIEIFRLLLARGADPNLSAAEYPAWKCVTHNRVHMLPLLVQAGVDLHQPPGIAEMAVEVGNTDALIWLLEQGGVSPDEHNARGHTPLTTALRENRPDLVQVLLDHGADAGARGEDWPLIMAVPHPELLERLLPSVANPRAVRGVLERAVAAGQLASVKQLLAAGVSVEDKTGGVFSPLTTSIREGHHSLTKFLLAEAGANPNSAGEHLPLVKAIRAGHHEPDGGAENLHLLLAHHADINLTYRGWNAVMQVLEDGNAELLNILVTEGGEVDLDMADDEGRTVAQMAGTRNWPEGSEILLAHAMKK